MSLMPSALFGEKTTEPRPAPPPRDPNEYAIWREIAGGALILLALFLTVCLFLRSGSESLVGPVGSMLASALHFLFGSYVAFLAPAVLLVLAIQLLRHRPIGWPWRRLAGLILVVSSVCGFLALPSADSTDIALRTETFHRAGALGAFLTDWHGVGIVGAFGLVGAAFVLGGVLFAGLVLTTGLGLGRIADLSVRWLRDREARKARPEFAGLPSQEEIAALESSRKSRVTRIATGKERNAPEEPRPLADSEDEIPRGELFDNDAEAALRALEAAEMDREFEEALRRELDARERGEAPAPTHREPVISFLEDGTAPRITSGNPANFPLPGKESALPPLAAGLAKLFPSRYPAKTEEDDELDIKEGQQDAGENRAFRRLGMGLKTNGRRGDSESDPLFDENLETRPRGPVAAMEEMTGERMETSAIATPMQEEPVQYLLPDIQLLDNPPKVEVRMSRDEMVETSQTLERTLLDFGIEGKVVEVKQGPVITQFELKPAAGVKVSRIVGLEDDIAMAMKAVSVRIIAPIPGKSVIGIEIPNRVRQGVYLKELIGTGDFWEQKSPLACALGRQIDGSPMFCDLKRMPHLLIAGATGAGKSVALNSIICSILYRQRPDQVRLIMVDPKRVELSVYDAIPHLIAPVVCDPKRAAAALAWAVEQMEDRYKLLVDFGVRNIDGYNAIVESPEKSRRAKGKTLAHMPHMVVIVDELADLMICARAEVEESIQRLAQMARAVGIHLILATQRPSVNVITGIIKANFPSRIAFQVSQKVDSRTILDQNGAESLLGRGDMLFSPGGVMKPHRVQGCFVSDEEVERIANFWRDQSGPNYEVAEFEPILSEKERKELARLMGSPESMDDLDMFDRLSNGGGANSRGTNKVMGQVTKGMFIPHRGGSAQSGDDEIDEALVRAAARIILEGRKGSTSLIQRRLKVGFARAGRLMDMLEEMGIVGPYKGSKPRDIMIDCEAGLAQLDILEKEGYATAPIIGGGEDLGDE